MTRTDSEIGDRTVRDETLGLLWEGRTAPTRGPKPALSIVRIADAAMRIADTEGLAAVSMQRVAAELDFTKMSLYRYVAGKAELLAIMIEAAVGDPPDLRRVRGGWRRKLETFARELAATWQRHPWLPWATVGDRPMGPRETAWTEAPLSALAGTGLTGGEQLDAVFVLFGHIRNTHSMSMAGTQAWTTDKQPSQPMAQLLPRHRERFPALTAALASAAKTGSADNGRAFGLRLLLDGLTLLIDERAARA